MAKRELSVTLKNLKFMQRASPKVEKPKEEETKPDGNFVSPRNVRRKCVVITEGDPHPGTIRGRMSFQNFNPSIDKLSDEAANGDEAEASTSSVFQSGKNLGKGNGVSERTEMDMDNGDGELKRKQPESVTQTSHSKKQQKKNPKQPSTSENRSSHKQSKRDKLDWNVLVQRKSQSKRQEN